MTRSSRRSTGRRFNRGSTKGDMVTHALAPADFGRLKLLDTCTASNAIERLDVRPRNEGFIHGTARCLFPGMPPTLGYAVTGRIRSSAQPISGGWYYDRIEWWTYVQSLPSPRVVVLQDVDPVPAFGAFVGEIHANIASALGCVACVTDGAVRDLEPVEALGFQLFAGGVSPSHAYAHIVDWGLPVDIGGLRINPGDLVHGDRHGVHTVPLAVAADVPRMAGDLDREERELIGLCQSSHFSIEALSDMFDRIRAADHLRATRSTPGVPPSSNT
jgi:4-hydroxy-4-methyl-2-oxoglutarate aldolase